MQITGAVDAQNGAVIEPFGAQDLFILRNSMGAPIVTAMSGTRIAAEVPPCCVGFPWQPS